MYSTNVTRGFKNSTDSKIKYVLDKRACIKNYLKYYIPSNKYKSLINPLFRHFTQLLFITIINLIVYCILLKQ